MDVPVYGKIGAVRMNTEKTKWTAVAVLWKSLAAVLVMILLIAGGRMAYQFGYDVFAQQALSDPPGKESAIAVQEGDSIAEIAETLEQKGVIQNALVFRVQELLSKYHGEIQPGTYVLNSSQTPDEIIQILTGTLSEEEE